MFNLLKQKNKTQQTTILVVDDEPDLVSTVQCRLEWAKYNVMSADNGQQALEKAAAEKPDLILLDINMPVMGGQETLEQLRGNPDLKDIPVIMCTAFCDPKDIAEASSRGIADYITKPFDYSVLMEKIANVLKNRKTQ